MKKICKHECLTCKVEWEHLFIPKEMPKCDREDYFLECSGCRLNKEFLK